MAQPVWTLSVDLQTKTATFQSGMADAAKAARSSFQEIKSGSEEMGRSMGGSMGEARHGIMLLGEELGIHLPRGVTAFVASLGPVASAMTLAFPFLALAVGAKVLMDHLEKTKEAAGKVSEAWRKVADVGADAMEHMQSKLVQAEIKADELAGKHLAALEKKLAEIDHSTMQDVISEIDKMGKAADEAFKQSEHGWFMQMLMGHADLGPAKAQLAGYLSEIDKLKHANAKPEDVLSLVKVDVADVQSKMSTIWNLMAQYRAEAQAASEAGDNVSEQGADIALQKAQEQWNAQQRILDTLKQQQEMAATGVKAAGVEKGNDRTEETNRATEAAKKLATENKEIAADYFKMAEGAIAFRKAQAETHVDRSGMEALRETLRMYAETVSAAKESARARLESDREATQGEIELARAQEEQALSAIRNAERVGLMSKREAVSQEMALEQQALTRKISDIERGAQKQIEAYQREIAAAQNADAAQSALGVKRGDQGYIDYLEQVNALQSKVAATTKKAANDEAIAAVQTQTSLGNLQGSLYQVRSAWDSLQTSVATTAARSIAEGKNMAQAFGQLGKQMLQQEMEHLMEIATVSGRERLEHARTAATAAYAWAGNPILGPIAAGATFAAVMAFEKGGIVPGVENFDSVNARVMPGEAILPKQLTENLSHATRHGNGSGGETHLHVHQTTHVHAMDAEGVDRVLTNHSATFEKHFHDSVRKMNH